MFEATGRSDKACLQPPLSYSCCRADDKDASESLPLSIWAHSSVSRPQDDRSHLHLLKEVARSGLPENQSKRWETWEATQCFWYSACTSPTCGPPLYFPCISIVIDLYPRIPSLCAVKPSPFLWDTLPPGPETGHAAICLPGNAINNSFNKVFPQIDNMSQCSFPNSAQTFHCQVVSLICWCFYLFI